MKRKIISISIEEGMISKLDKILKLNNVSRSRYIENLLFHDLISEGLDTENYHFEENEDNEETEV